MNIMIILRNSRVACVKLQRTFCSAKINSSLIDNITKYYQKVSSSHASLQGKTEAVNLKSLMGSFDNISTDLKSLDEEINNNKNDKELVNLMRAEYDDIKMKQGELIEEILDEILELDRQSSNELDSYSKSSKMLFEISPGVGGKEAMLFANEISSLYTKYFAAKRWTVSDLDVDENNGYLRHFHAAVQGFNVWDHLRFEAGVHRVQRVPATEVRSNAMCVSFIKFSHLRFLSLQTRGRIHTSTVSVACIPITDGSEIEINGKLHFYFIQTFISTLHGRDWLAN